jgi:excisionase family DNA binding protein
MNEQEPTAAPLNPDPLVDIPTAAEFLFTSDRHIRHLISKREITVTRIGNKIRFRISDLNTYVISRQTPAKVGE